MTTTRRHLLRESVLLTGGAAFARALPAQSKAPQATIELTISPDPIATVPADFTGLGYELSSAARTGMLSAHNTSYCRLVEHLGERGVLRLGGIVADFSSYVAKGTPAHDPKHTVITRANLVELRGFLERTNWTAIWSVNFGAGTLPDAIEEARAVHETLGPRLLALELGNEVDNYGHGAHPLRKPPYNFADFRAEYTRWRAAILAAVPGLPFAAPDSAGDSHWLEQMADSAHDDVQLLTTHYYRGDQRKATLDQLLQPDSNLAAELARLRSASEQAKIPWRMCETSSFYGGGHPGISDTLAGALWTLDYMLLLASSGCAGVNLETGFNQLGFLSSYSPIRNDEAGNISVGAPYYGMLAFDESQAAGSTMHPVTLTPSSPAVTAYACSAHGEAKTLIVLNKGADDLSAHIPGLHGPAKVLRLTGPSITSTSGIRLGGAEVDTTGGWSSAPWTTLKLTRTTTIPIPSYSAVLLQYDYA